MRTRYSTRVHCCTTRCLIRHEPLVGTLGLFPEAPLGSVAASVPGEVGLRSAPEASSSVRSL